MSRENFNHLKEPNGNLRTEKKVEKNLLGD